MSNWVIPELAEKALAGKEQQVATGPPDCTLLLPFSVRACCVHNDTCFSQRQSARQSMEQLMRCLPFPMSCMLMPC